MGEAKDRADAAAAAKAEFEKLLATPITGEELEKAKAEADVETMQLVIARQKLFMQQDALRGEIAQLQMQVDAINVRIEEIGFNKNVLFRRALNPKEQVAAQSAGSEK